MPIAAGTASVLLQKVSPSITPRPLDSPMEGTYSSSTPPPAAVRSTAATAGGEASSTTASLDDVISLAARTLNPDHLRNASNEELLRIMQTLKKQQQPQASTSSQEPVKGNSSPMNEDSRVASDDVAAPVNGIAAAAAESDSQPMSGVQSFSPNKNDMRRQSVSLPVFSDKGSSSQMYNIDRRGSLGSLPRMLGMTDRDEDSRRASYGQIPLPSDGEGFSKDGDNENSFRIPLARSASPQQSSSALTTASSPQAFDQRLRLEVEATLHKT
ncbi:hypothetical protein BC829DRAFT_268438 [Chytridium lagenaria]|nr:hypothetical protein BC829DRAFT_268438 [Chytridium lagenaria]